MQSAEKSDYASYAQALFSVSFIVSCEDRFLIHAVDDRTLIRRGNHLGIPLQIAGEVFLDQNLGGLFPFCQCLVGNFQLNAVVRNVNGDDVAVL